jgi:hypothetical protein
MEDVWGVAGGAGGGQRAGGAGVVAAIVLQQGELKLALCADSRSVAGQALILTAKAHTISHQNKGQTHTSGALKLARAKAATALMVAASVGSQH